MVESYGGIHCSCQVIRLKQDTDDGNNFSWGGWPAKRYPNKKDPEHFTDILYGGTSGNVKGDGHGHIIVENATGDIVFHRRPGESDPIVFEKDRCPGINEQKKNH